ncbi:LPS-assembly protein LptD [Rhodospirillaceae bacterium KN72]|uniref:LPS-assembly protein LptD n=1 Tax=Pacificispira spongiicola TaxID=2729598 RepID=A0A7Y0E2Z6_9PROT|nr:LPS assembly protein LptD [Pacificispira spongiicola]NMM46290.1 LPS-assembly protein LptD [Pacificispira spongiicola]
MRMTGARSLAGIALLSSLIAVGASISASAQTTASQAAPEQAQTVDASGMPILLRADEVSQDQELGVIVARGSVEIAHGSRILLSDTLSYNQNSKTVTASGNVQILEETGEVIFADYVELTEDLKEGTIENLRILLADNARIAAAGGRRSNGNVTEMVKGVYSPCNVCEDDPTSPPLWQVKAGTVVHNQADKQIEYYDASLELYGVPVAYTPYFTHPDPTVKRQTGLLAPSFGTKTSTGAFLQTPFFWNIGPDRDATIDPIFTTEQGGFFSGEYRQAYDTGEFDLSGSFTFDDRRIGDTTIERIDEDAFRGHIYSNGKFDLDETWRAGWSLNRSTDQTYLRRYGFWNDPGNSMLSTAYAEGFRGRNYMSAKAMTFQDLRLGQRSDAPVVLPVLDYAGLGEADKFGGRWAFNANVRSLYDGDDADSQRVSLDTGYRKEFVSSIGIVTTASAGLRSDLYYVDQISNIDEQGRSVEDGFVGRVVPRVALESRYPFVRYSEGGRQVIEPVVAIFASPNGGNDPSIPLSESAVFETDDINILAKNRINGLDRLETGQRAVAGITVSDYSDDGGLLSAFLGQSYRFHDDNDLKLDTGIENSRSDWVGRVTVVPNKYLAGYYRFNMKSDEFLANRNELSLRVGGEGLNVTSNYTFVRSSLDSAANDVEQVSLSVGSKFNDFWAGRASTLRDLTDDGGALSHSLQLVYEDECFIFDSSFTRNYTYSADVEKENAMLFRLTFKTLTEVEF